MRFTLKAVISITALVILTSAFSGCSSNSGTQLPTDPATQKAAITGSAPPADVVAKMKAGQAAADAAYAASQSTLPHPPANQSSQ